MPVCDGGQCSSEPGVRIDGVHLAGFDHRREDCPVLGTGVMVVDIAQVKSEALAQGVDAMSLEDWGGLQFRRKDAPSPRRGLK